MLLPEGSGEGTSFKLSQVDGSIYFLVVVGLRYPFPCWLSAGLFSAPSGQLDSHCSLLPSGQLLMLKISLKKKKISLTSSSITSLRKSSSFIGLL